MTAKRKHPDVKQIHENARYEREKLSGAIADTFPGVKDITIELLFKDPESQRRKDSMNYNYASENKAFFEFRCPHYECVNGGFDFSEEVRATIRSREIHSKGKKVFHGWQDTERINQHQCLLEAIYAIYIKYSGVQLPGKSGG